MSRKQQFVPVPRFRWRRGRAGRNYHHCYLGNLYVGDVVDFGEGEVLWGRVAEGRTPHTGTVPEAKALLQDDVLEALGWKP